MAKRVLVVDDDDMMRKMTSGILTRHGFDVLNAENGRDALAQVQSTRPDLILLDVMMPEMDGYEACRRIRADPATGTIPVLMLTSLASVEQKVKGFEAGADDYLAKPYEAEELVARVNVLLKRSEALPQLPAPVSSAPAQNARTIAAFSLRGGAGVSTIAVNLAGGLAALWGQPVALVDMVLIAGQTALFLNQSLRNTWSDLGQLKEIDSEAVRSALLHHDANIFTLASPRRPEESELVTAEKAAAVLDILRSQFPYVLIDMPHDLSERSLQALDRADVILLVVQPEIASVRAASMALEIFEALGYSEKKIHLVVNWTFPHKGLALPDLEKFVNRKADLVLPCAQDEFVEALNYGRPPVFEDPEGSLAAIFEDMAMVLSKEEQRKSRPRTPTPAWGRVAERIRKRK
jgi:pilus assembly protein CpaE